MDANESPAPPFGCNDFAASVVSRRRSVNRKFVFERQHTGSRTPPTVRFPSIEGDTRHDRDTSDISIRVPKHTHVDTCEI